MGAKRYPIMAYPKGALMTARSHLKWSGAFGAFVLIFATLVFPSQLALAQRTLPKLLPGGTVGASNVGFAVALSAVGDTAMVGGWGDNSNVGAVWVFTRRGSAWTQQGDKLVSPDAVGPAYQGYSVSLSADGNTAIVGGANDNSGIGAVWVWTRSGDAWTQQGGKLVGTGVSRRAQQGWSVALSHNGNTIVLGAPEDNGGIGAAWVFTRSGDAWVQQGDKLVGTEVVGPAALGTSVALSRDGDTMMMGGYRDRDFVGAAWVFTRSGDTWTQQGKKLVGVGVGRGYQGYSVSLSGDGNTAIVGGPTDDNIRGAAWIYVRRSDTWYVLGNKLVGAGAVGLAGQGVAVAISAGADTAIVGGRLDDGGVGAAWVFAAGPSPPGGR
jgi:hypothetical protein